jgi:hypothetical protein
MKDSIRRWRRSAEQYAGRLAHPSDGLMQAARNASSIPHEPPHLPWRAARQIAGLSVGGPLA